VGEEETSEDNCPGKKEATGEKKFQKGEVEWGTTGGVSYCMKLAEYLLDGGRERKKKSHRGGGCQNEGAPNAGKSPEVKGPTSGAQNKKKKKKQKGSSRWKGTQGRPGGGLDQGGEENITLRNNRFSTNKDRTPIEGGLWERTSESNG